MNKKDIEIINRQLYEAALRLGDESEEFVEELLREYSSKNKLPLWLLGWNRHEKWSWHDIRGIDITIYTDSGEIYINVKSSYAFVNRFVRQHKDEDIIVFVVDRKKGRGEIFRDLLEAIKKKYQPTP